MIDKSSSFSSIQNQSNLALRRGPRNASKYAFRDAKKWKIFWWWGTDPAQAPLPVRRGTPLLKPHPKKTATIIVLGPTTFFSEQGPV